MYGASGTSYAAEFWQYDPRTARRWNLDPVRYPFQSSYSTFNNDPIRYMDPNGLYGTKAEAKQMRREAKAAGLNPRKVYKASNQWGFNTSEGESVVGNFKRTFFGESSSCVQDASDLGEDHIFQNPVNRLTGLFQSMSLLDDFSKGLKYGEEYFDPNSGFSYMMKNSPGVRKAVDEFIATAGDQTSRAYGFSPNTASIGGFWSSLPESIGAHWNVVTDVNMARLTTGGYTAVITPTSNDNIIRIHLNNDMSLGSLLLHTRWAEEHTPLVGPFHTVSMKIDLGLFNIESLRKK